MTLVRIVKSWTTPDLLRQTPGGAGVWDGVRFTLDPVDRCDYLIALNHIPRRLTVEVAPENVWCVIQEPPIAANRWAEKGVPGYGRFLTQDRRLRGPKITHTHGSLPWHVDRSFDELSASVAQPEKTRDLSWITSNANRLDGHRKRLGFLASLQRSGISFDLFGRGFTPIADKWDGLAPYRYAIAVENHSSPDYWTEKIADCFLAGTMPLYFGATNVSSYFPTESYVWIDINDPATPDRIAEVVRSDRAERSRDALAEARRRVLQEHNLFPRLVRLIAEDRAARPVVAPQRLELPGVPDRSAYYLRTSWHRRFRDRVHRRLGR